MKDINLSISFNNTKDMTQCLTCMNKKICKFNKFKIVISNCTGYEVTDIMQWFTIEENRRYELEVGVFTLILDKNGYKENEWTLTIFNNDAFTSTFVIEGESVKTLQDKSITILQTYLTNIEGETSKAIERLSKIKEGVKVENNSNEGTTKENEVNN